MYKLEYDGNDKETYTLLFNQMPQAELLLSEDGAIEIVNDINSFLDQFASENEQDIIEVKNDDEKLGVIVDVWDNEQTECIETCCFWFDDYSN